MVDAQGIFTNAQLVQGLKNCNLNIMQNNNDSENVHPNGSSSSSQENNGETGANAPLNAQFGDEEKKTDASAKEEVKGGMEPLAAQMVSTEAPGIKSEHKPLA